MHHLRKCDAVRVVVDMGRVKNDSSTFKVLTKMLKGFGNRESGKIALTYIHSEVSETSKYC